MIIIKKSLYLWKVNRQVKLTKLSLSLKLPISNIVQVVVVKTCHQNKIQDYIHTNKKSTF